MALSKAKVILGRPLGWPFGPSRALFTLALLIAAALWFVMQPCYQGPRYFEVAYAAVVLTTACWLCAPAQESLKSWSRIASACIRLGGSLISFGFLLIISLLACALFTPTYQCYTDRARTSELVLEASKYKENIELNIVRRKSLQNASEGVVFKPEGRAQAGGILANGAIVVLGEKPTALVMLRPLLVSGAVSWECLGFPAKVLPASCRNTPIFDTSH